MFALQCLRAWRCTDACTDARADIDVPDLQRWTAELEAEAEALADLRRAKKPRSEDDEDDLEHRHRLMAAHLVKVADELRSTHATLAAEAEAEISALRIHYAQTSKK